MTKKIISTIIVLTVLTIFALIFLSNCGKKNDKKEQYGIEGIAKMDAQDYEGAIESFLLALSQDHGFVEETDFDINYYLGYAYYKIGEYEKAIETYDAILALKPKQIDGYYYRGLCELKLGYRKEADEDFKVVTKSDPKNFDLYLDVYFCLVDAGLEEDAKTYLQTALKSSANMNDYDKGRFYYYLGDYSNAIIFLEKAKKMSDPESILMLGKACEAIEQYDNAADLYREYLEAKGNNAAVYNQLGVCLMKKEQYKAALNSFVSGLKLGDKGWEQELLYNEAVAYEYLLDFETAYVKMGEYIAKYPRDEKARREYEFLGTR